MNKAYKKIAFLGVILTILIIISSNTPVLTNSNIENKDTDKVYKVAFYNHPPYYYVEDNSKISGYYHDIMELISKNLNIKYEYVYVDIKDCMDRLANNEIDILFGVSKNSYRERNILLTKNSIGKEDVSVYTKKDIEEEDLRSLEGLKFGYIKNESNNDLFRDILRRRNIDVELIEYFSYEELKKALIKNDIDFSIGFSLDNDLEGYNKILDFSVGELYIASSIGNDELVDSIDKFIEKNVNSRYDNQIKKLYVRYFNQNIYKNKNMFIAIIILIFFITTILSFILYNKLRKKNKIKKLKNSIRSDLEKENYLLYYQPIINPKTNKVKGYEGLLRLKDGNNIISPHVFLNNIENSNMMREVSLWVLQKAISDYKTIKEYGHMVDDHFYISINLSFKEIEDEDFISSIETLLKNSNLRPNSICLEIVERFGISDLQKIQQSIYKLKEAGFRVAIDDFGVEYSNLDILEKIDCDIVKLDKYFIDNIETSYIRKEVVNFISNVCNYTNKTVVCEGVETKYQKDLIKNIKNERFYIQGYFYSKPLDINDLKTFKL